MTDATTVYADELGADRERRVLEYVPLVHHVLGRLTAAVPPHVDRDDLLGAGVVGLVQAARSFDATKGASFKSHAFTRVRGAILDELRRQDPLPKRKREQVRALEAAQSRLLASGAPPSPEDLARALGVSEAELDELLALSRLAAPLTQDATEGAEAVSREDDPAALATQRERLAALVEGLEALPAREREVVGLYYFEGLLLRQIGELLGVTESRACQLHARAVLLLRGSLASRGVVS